MMMMTAWLSLRRNRPRRPGCGLGASCPVDLVSIAANVNVRAACDTEKSPHGQGLRKSSGSSD